VRDYPKNFRLVSSTVFLHCGRWTWQNVIFMYERSALLMFNIVATELALRRQGREWALWLMDLRSYMFKCIRVNEPAASFAVKAALWSSAV
jgi:hypothetical protein